VWASKAGYLYDKLLARKRSSLRLKDELVLRTARRLSARPAWLPTRWGFAKGRRIPWGQCREEAIGHRTDRECRSVKSISPTANCPSPLPGDPSPEPASDSSKLKPVHKEPEPRDLVGEG